MAEQQHDLTGCPSYAAIAQARADIVAAQTDAEAKVARKALESAYIACRNEAGVPIPG